MRVVRGGRGVAVVAVLGLALTACLPTKTYTYRIATRGPVTADVAGFASAVALTLADPRGWSLNGALTFRQTDGPADFVLWLSTAASVPSFGAPCSSQWSCRIGSNVIINETRWQEATPQWPYGVDSYRRCVVGHEVGHWLGLGHSGCPGFGERAPVMVQQSKGGGVLGPCRYNVWPTPGERSAVAGIQGVTAGPIDLPTPDDPFGAVDLLGVSRDEQGHPTEVRAVGWALDGDTAGPLAVVLVINGRPVNVARADQPRPDVAGAFPRFGDAHGYDFSTPVPTESVTACVVVFGDGAGLSMQTLGCQVVK